MTPQFYIFLLFLLIPCCFSINPQAQALLSWRKTLKAPNLELLNSWNDSNNENPCGWFGVTCDVNNNVVELSLRYVDLLGSIPSDFTSLLTLRKLVLSGTNLTGSIPKSIGSLQELNYLDLSDNGLTGEIPKELCALERLVELYINTNRLQGSIPVEIENMKNLVILTCYDNQLSGNIPGSIGELKKLQVIRAGGNKNIEGSLPEEIGNCTSLVMLGIAETSLSGFLPSTIGNLKKLQTLAIYTSLLSGQFPPEIGDCTDLQNIYLYENSLSGSVPSTLGNLKNLKNLLLWQNNLVGIIPPELGNCLQLVLIDISMNSLTGVIPVTFGNLTSLQELQLSMNQISGSIPTQIGNCRSLTHIELDNNQITGTIPAEIGNFENLTLLFLWQNQLEGAIPSSISSCQKLEAIDLSQNSLTGPIPKGLFDLNNLNKLLLLGNELSGQIPPEIGNCSSLIRFRANDNHLNGFISPEIGRLTNLNFLDLGSNRLTGIIPPEISGCQNLTFLDLHSNSITGSLPASLDKIASLQLIDVSENQIEGALSPNLGSLVSLNKLVLRNNRFSGPIPSEIGSCMNLQLLDLSSNEFSGEIPSNLGKLPALEIALNLSCNKLSGKIPPEFAALDKLGVLDLSYNLLSGDLKNLVDLENLVALNISHNDFKGYVPNTPFFSKLPLSVLADNPSLCLAGNKCAASNGGTNRRSKGARVAMAVLIGVACILLLSAFYIILAGKMRAGERGMDEADVEMGVPWEITLYQKLDLSIADMAKYLTPDNVVGRGRSGVVYRANIPSGFPIAVKRFQLSETYSAAAFSSEIATLARIRHRNIVRLLGWAANGKNKLLFYDFLPNGTLGRLLHDGNIEVVEWETRFKIALGVAQGLAYLHHDCVPPILHRDVKVENILLGDRNDACLADFGLARLVEDDSTSFSVKPQFAGSYGYMAPEYAIMLKITEKSDVFSYGVVLLEIITCKKPVDESFSEGQHVIQWVRDHLKSKKDPVHIIDQKLHGNPDSQIQEMLQALGIALLCTSTRPEDRPTMKDVVALLREIRHEPATTNESHKEANDPRKDSNTSGLFSSSSVTPAQLLVQGSSNSSLAYST
ncbi:hypothetical protein R6Q57_000377 [Mikania cordata]